MLTTDRNLKQNKSNVIKSTINRRFHFIHLNKIATTVLSNTPLSVAEEMICYSNYDAIVVVCDGTCLERNLNLLLQITELRSKVILCVNLIDEAERKKIRIDSPLLSDILGIPVVGTSAKSKKGLTELVKVMERICENVGNITLSGNGNIISRLAELLCAEPTGKGGTS